MLAKLSALSRGKKAPHSKIKYQEEASQSFGFSEVALAKFWLQHIPSYNPWQGMLWNGRKILVWNKQGWGVVSKNKKRSQSFSKE